MIPRQGLCESPEALSRKEAAKRPLSLDVANKTQGPGRNQLVGELPERVNLEELGSRWLIELFEHSNWRRSIRTLLRPQQGEFLGARVTFLNDASRQLFGDRSVSFRREECGAPRGPG